MRFRPTDIRDVVVVEQEYLRDDRGAFARTFCRSEFEHHGLDGRCVQASISVNPRAGTLRGMHYQIAPHQEAKLVRVSRGAIFDVALDLRPQSPTYLAWYGIELTSTNGRMLYIGEGLAHGFLTLHDDTEVTYLMSHPYEPPAARSVRWNDPAFSIRWPGNPVVISDRDANQPDFCSG